MDYPFNLIISASMSYSDEIQFDFSMHLGESKRTIPTYWIGFQSVHLELQQVEVHSLFLCDISDALLSSIPRRK